MIKLRRNVFYHNVSFYIVKKLVLGLERATLNADRAISEAFTALPENCAYGIRIHDTTVKAAEENSFPHLRVRLVNAIYHGLQ
jgi:hypothetical protein